MSKVYLAYSNQGNYFENATTWNECWNIVSQRSLKVLKCILKNRTLTSEITITIKIASVSDLVQKEVCPFFMFCFNQIVICLQCIKSFFFLHCIASSLKATLSEFLVRYKSVTSLCDTLRSHVLCSQFVVNKWSSQKGNSRWLDLILGKKLSP